MGFASCCSFLLFFLFLFAAGNSTGNRRQLLHHPFFPISTAIPPIQPPSIAPAAQPPPQAQPKYPFTGGPFTPEKPFFPTVASPPPPSVSALATFPANVSDLLFPHPPSAAVSHRHLIITIVISLSLLIAAVVAAISAFLLYSRRRETSRSDDPRLFPPDSVPSDCSPKPPKLPHRPGVPNRSSEFLYLGILSNSKSGVDHPQSVAKASNAGVKIGASSSPYRKLGSPELKPLPPLPKHNYTPTYRSGEVLVRPCKEDEADNGTEEGNYFSPSPERKESPARVESSSRREFAGHFGSYPYSNSCSPSNSIGSSSSPGSNSSPRSTKSKLPETKISIPPMLKPVKRSPLSISLSSSPSLSGNSDYSPARLESIESQFMPTPAPPLRRSREFPVVGNDVDLRRSGPPVLVAPSRPILVPNAMLGQFQSNPKVERIDPNNGRRSLTFHNQENYVLDSRKSQEIAMLLRSLNVTIDEVCEALLQGNLDTLGAELLESLLKMAPTREAECKLKELSDEFPHKLGPAEKFLKAFLDIPFAFKRVDALLYIANFDLEVDYLNKSFQTLEAACQELKKSRMFLKLLEAVLKAGNHLNADTNHAFKLDTLLKLVDVKGTDGKTTLLHFVVQEIIRSEGSRLSRANHNQTASTFQDDVEFEKLGLQVVSALSGELSNVKRAAAMDPYALSNEVRKLAAGISKVTDLVKSNKETSLKQSSRRFSGSMEGFLKKAEKEIVRIQSEERLVFTLVKEINEYFHGSSDKEEAHPLRIFHIVRDFLAILDQVCKDVGKINERTIYSLGRPMPENSNYPVFNGRPHHNSSDNESL